MSEYIERGALLQLETFLQDADGFDCSAVLSVDIRSAKAADVVEVNELKEFAADVVYQFGYPINYNGRLHLSTGGLSTLEWAFSILGWEGPKPYPEGECEWDGCHEDASCGTKTPDGYKRVCSKHALVIEARKEADKMDGGKDNATD